MPWGRCRSLSQSGPLSRRRSRSRRSASRGFGAGHGLGAFHGVGAGEGVGRKSWGRRRSWSRRTHKVDEGHGVGAVHGVGTGQRVGRRSWDRCRPGGRSVVVGSAQLMESAPAMGPAQATESAQVIAGRGLVTGHSRRRGPVPRGSSPCTTSSRCSGPRASSALCGPWRRCPFPASSPGPGATARSGRAPSRCAPGAASNRRRAWVARGGTPRSSPVSTGTGTPACRSTSSSGCSTTATRALHRVGSRAGRRGRDRSLVSLPLLQGLGSVGPHQVAFFRNPYPG